MQTERMPTEAPNPGNEPRIAAGRGGDGDFSILDAPRRGIDRAIFGLSMEQLSELCGKLATPGYRVRQLAEALYRGWIGDLGELTTWPKDLRERLAGEGYAVGLPEIAQTFRSVDGTERYLIACNDGKTVEAVWMPEGDDGEAGDGSEAGAEATDQNGDWDGDRDGDRDGGRDGGRGGRMRRRATICVSSQIGCAVNCQFCLTAKLGMQRNLTAGEIAGQVVAVLKRRGARVGRDRVNLVFMGMGEPFLNYDEFMAAVRLLAKEVGIADMRMTVSTSGIVPGILRFAAEKVRPKLAISLNASNDEVRERIMPITRKWEIGEVIDAVRQVPLRNREHVMFEYVVLGGVNDRLEHADEAIALLRRANLRCKVNLIVWNPGPGVDFHKPEAGDVAAFQQRLIGAGIPTYVRKPRGLDIFAACGQLKRTTS